MVCFLITFCVLLTLWTFHIVMSIKDLGLNQFKFERQKGARFLAVEIARTIAVERAHHSSQELGTAVVQTEISM